MDKDKKEVCKSWTWYSKRVQQVEMNEEKQKRVPVLDLVFPVGVAG